MEFNAVAGRVFSDTGCSAVAHFVFHVNLRFNASDVRSSSWEELREISSWTSWGGTAEKQRYLWITPPLSSHDETSVSLKKAYDQMLVWKQVTSNSEVRHWKFSTVVKKSENNECYRFSVRKRNPSHLLTHWMGARQSRYRTSLVADKVTISSEWVATSLSARMQQAKWPRMNHDGWIYTVHISNSGSDGSQLDLRLCSTWKWCDSRPTHSPSLLKSFCFFTHFPTCFVLRSMRLFFNMQLVKIRLREPGS